MSLSYKKLREYASEFSFIVDETEPRWMEQISHSRGNMSHGWLTDFIDFVQESERLSGLDKVIIQRRIEELEKGSLSDQVLAQDLKIKYGLLKGNQ